MCHFNVFRLLANQKSFTRRSDPNLDQNLSDIGIYDEVNKLSELDINGECVFACLENVTSTHYTLFRLE